MSQSSQDPQEEIAPMNTLVAGYPVSQDVLRLWGERNVQTEANATDADKMQKYFYAIVLWATRQFGGYCNIEVYGDEEEILEHKIIFRTQRGTWSGGYRGIDPKYIPHYIETPDDVFLKGVLEKEFGEFQALLAYLLSHILKRHLETPLYFATVLKE